MATWPSTLPKPQVPDYAYQPADPILRTDMTFGPARHRRQYTAFPTTIQVAFDFTQLQMHIFESWHKLEIGDGAEWFNIQLYSGAGLSTFEARFVGPFQAKLLSGTDFRVTAILEVRSRPTMNAATLAPYL